MWDVDSACRYDAKERGMQAFKNSCLRRLLRILYIRPMNFAKNHYHTHRIPETSPCNSEAVLVWCDHVIQHNVLSKTVLLETLSIWHCSGQRKTGLRTWRSGLVLCRTHSLSPKTGLTGGACQLPPLSMWYRQWPVPAKGRTTDSSEWRPSRYVPHAMSNGKEVNCLYCVSSFWNKKLHMLPKKKKILKKNK